MWCSRQWHSNIGAADVCWSSDTFAISARNPPSLLGRSERGQAVLAWTPDRNAGNKIRTGYVYGIRYASEYVNSFELQNWMVSESKEFGHRHFLSHGGHVPREVHKFRQELDTQLQERCCDPDDLGRWCSSKTIRRSHLTNTFGKGVSTRQHSWLSTYIGLTSVSYSAINPHDYRWNHSDENRCPSALWHPWGFSLSWQLPRRLNQQVRWSGDSASDNPSGADACFFLAGIVYNISSGFTIYVYLCSLQKFQVIIYLVSCLSHLLTFSHWKLDFPGQEEDAVWHPQSYPGKDAETRFQDGTLMVFA